jgi:hypothetical protein
VINCVDGSKRASNVWFQMRPVDASRQPAVRSIVNLDPSISRIGDCVWNPACIGRGVHCPAGKSWNPAFLAAWPSAARCRTGSTLLAADRGAHKQEPATALMPLLPDRVCPQLTLASVPLANSPPN